MGTLSWPVLRASWFLKKIHWYCCENPTVLNNFHIYLMSTELKVIKGQGWNSMYIKNAPFNLLVVW